MMMPTNMQPPQAQLPTPQPAPPQQAAPPAGQPDANLPAIVNKISLAGQKLMYDEKTFPLLKNELLKPQPMPTNLARATAGIMKMLDRRMMEEQAKKGQPRKGLPRKAIIPAATALLFEMVQFVQEFAKKTPESKLTPPGEAETKQAMEIMIKLLLKEYGVIDKLKQAMAKKQGQGVPPKQPPQNAQPLQPAAPPARPQGLINAQGAM